MNNEQYQQIIDDVYKNYCKSFEPKDSPYDFRIKGLFGNPLTKEEFINRIKTDEEFAKKWGVTIYTEVEEDEVWMGIVYNGNAAKIKIQ